MARSGAWATGDPASGTRRVLSWFGIPPGVHCRAVSMSRINTMNPNLAPFQMWGQGLLAQDLLQGGQAWAKAACAPDLGVSLCFVDGYGWSLGLSVL